MELDLAQEGYNGFGANAQQSSYRPPQLDENGQPQVGAGFVEPMKRFWGNNHKWIIWILALVVFAIIITLISRPFWPQVKTATESFFAETPNGVLSSQTYAGDKGLQNKFQYGDKSYETPVVMDGMALSVVGIPGNTLTSGIESSQRADANLFQQIQENYQRPRDDSEIPDRDESEMMSLMKNQTTNTNIQQDLNLTNSIEMQKFDLMKQNTALLSKPMQDINELEQQNRDAQLAMDHKAMIGKAFGAGMQVAPYNPNADISAKIRYTQNSGRPTNDMYSEQSVPIKESIEFNREFDIKREAMIKSQGESIPVPNINSLQDSMQRTTFTQEPKVQENKIILQQQLVNTPESEHQKVLVEQTVVPDIIHKVENENYTSWPTALFTKDQKTAAGQFMTILILMKSAGIKIPDLKTLSSDFSEINKMKGGTFKQFDASIQRWAQQEIDAVNSGQKSIDTIINRFKQIYKIDPVQSTSTGVLQKDNSIKKETVALVAPLGSGAEGYTRMQNGKRKFIIKKERYTVQLSPNGISKISGRSSQKFDYVV